MKRTFRPRGIVKWHPFASLYDPVAESFAIDALNQALMMVDLSDDQIAEINRQIQEVYENQYDVQIRFFTENRFEVVAGKIEKIDVENQRILIENKWLNLSVIVDIM